jgi:hypothetical protein
MVGEALKGRAKQLRGGAVAKDRWILRATSREVTEPKPKYVRLLVVDTWESQGAMEWVFRNLDSRPLASHPVVAFKALVVIFKLLQQGPPEVLPGEILWLFSLPFALMIREL